MTRKEIEKILEQNDSTVLSFKDRGPWGDNKYRETAAVTSRLF